MAHMKGNRMKRLTKGDSEQQESLVRCLREKADAVREVREKINALITGELNPAIAEYNGVLADATEFRDEIVGRMDDYISERSEKWAEGEAGESYTSWKDDWEAVSLDDMEDENELEIEEGCETADELEGLSSGPAD
jgi:hypothetical protein